MAQISPVKVGAGVCCRDILLLMATVKALPGRGNDNAYPGDAIGIPLPIEFTDPRSSGTVEQPLGAFVCGVNELVT